MNNINISGLSNSELSKAAFPVFDELEYSQFNAHDVYLDTSFFFSNGFVKLPTIKQHYPSHNVETVIDALQEFILGIDGGPALQDLDRKYKQLWRMSYRMEHKDAYMARRDVTERFVKLVVEDGLTNAQAIETLERIQDGTALLHLQEVLQTIAQSNVGRPAFPGGPSPYACFKAGEFDPPRKGTPTAAVRRRPDKREIPIIRLDEGPKGVRDILLSWRFGFNGRPAVQDLYRRYDHYWKHPDDTLRFSQHTVVVNKFLDLVLNKRFTEESAIRRLESKQKSSSLGVLRTKLLTKTAVEKRKIEADKRRRQRALAKKKKEKEKKEDARRKRLGLPKLNRNIQVVVEATQDDTNKEEEADDNDPDSEKNNPYYPYTRFRAEEFKILEDDAARNRKEWETPDTLVPRLCNEVWTVAELLQEWRFGLRGGQAIQDLDCKYGRRWRVVSDKQKYKCRRAVVQAYVRLVLDSKLSNKKAIMWLEALRGTKTLEGLQAAILSTPLPAPPPETGRNQSLSDQEEESDTNSNSDTDSHDEGDDESDVGDQSLADAQKGAKQTKGSEDEDEDSENGDEESSTGHQHGRKRKKESTKIADSDSENTEDSDGDNLTDAPKVSKRVREESMTSAHSDEEEGDNSDEESHKVELRDSKRAREDMFVSAHRRHRYEEVQSDSDDSSPEGYEKRLYRRHKTHRNIWRNSSDRRKRQDGGKGPLNWPAVPAFFIGTSGYHVKSITKVPYPVRFVSSFKEVWDEWKVGWKGEPSIESLVRPLGGPLLPRLKWERKAYRIIRLKKVIVMAIEYVVSEGVVNSAEEAINILDDARGIMHPLGFVLREDCRELFARWGVPKVLFNIDQTA